MPTEESKRKEVIRLMSELKRGDMEEQTAWKTMVLQGLSSSENKPTVNELKLAEAVGETEWGQKATITLGQHVNRSNPDLWITKSLVENADSRQEEIRAIL